MPVKLELARTGRDGSGTALNIPHQTGTPERSSARSVAAFDVDAGIAESFGKLSFDTGRLRASDALEVEGRPREYLDAAFENAAGGTYAGLVLIESLRRGVL